MSQQDELAQAVRAVAQTQDRQAFALIFGHFAPRVKAYLLRLGADGASAEDLMQEIMLSVWRHAGSYDPAQAAVSTWIFTIARNRRIDALRRARRPEIAPADPRASSPTRRPRQTSRSKPGSGSAA